MSASVAIRRRAVLPVAAAVLGSAALLYPTRKVYADSQVTEPEGPSRKPIYDSPPPQTSSWPSFSSTPSPTPNQENNNNPIRKNTPTDRLATQIARLRLTCHRRAVTAEDALNSALTRAFRLEHSFTSTIASLAPPRESGEKLVPGLLYALVGTMAGSMVTRNRNVLLRASVPLAFGVGVAYVVVPVTMRNVGELAWSYERRWPVVAENHVRVKERVGRLVETGREHAMVTVGMVEEKIAGTRERVEEWVRKGK